LWQPAWRPIYDNFTPLNQQSGITMVKATAKKILYRAGILNALHRLRNRRTLTVAMFHRVLPKDDPRWVSAIREWTLSEDVFEASLQFFCRHYNPVSLDDVRAAAAGDGRLVDHALLVSFDDGYADVEEIAAPILHRYGVPGVVFVFSDAIDADQLPWQEAVAAAWEQGRLQREDVAQFHAAAFPESRLPPTQESGSLMQEIVRRGGAVDPESGGLAPLLNELVQGLHSCRQMMTREQITRLSKLGVEVAAHGKHHIAMTLAGDLGAELQEPAAILSDILERGAQVDALSFPHGQYNDRILLEASAAGYALMFTSDAVITPTDSTGPLPKVLGRLHVSGSLHARDTGFRPELLALDFFRADKKTIVSMP
jgi:peptidoglycan/xylan/chitin deacetylase (PgdA/CDA1 family)